MMSGWVMLGIILVVDIAIYWAIDLGFEKNFWREDETR